MGRIILIVVRDIMGKEFVVVRVLCVVIVCDCYGKWDVNFDGCSIVLRFFDFCLIKVILSRWVNVEVVLELFRWCRNVGNLLKYFS